MNRRILLFLFCVFCVSGITLFTGCPSKSDSTGRTPDVGGGASDAKWRGKLLRNTLDSIQKLADTPSPGECRQELIQAVSRLNSWIKDEPTPPGWRIDPLAEKWTAIFDGFEETRPALENTVLSLYDPEKHPPKLENLVTVCQKFHETAEKIPDGFPPVMRFLKRYLQQTSRQIFAFLQKKDALTPEEKEAFIRLLEEADVIVKRLGVLCGSSRMAFLDGEVSPADAENLSQTLRFAFLADSAILFENFLMRDASRWAQGTATNVVRTENLETASVSDVSGPMNEIIISADDLRRAAAIFDWTVMNIALKEDMLSRALRDFSVSAPTRTPTEILLGGQGTALERAWVFMLLARQQGLNVILIKIPTFGVLPETETGEETDADLLPVTAVAPPVDRYLAGYVASDAVYLFDPELGIPLSRSVSSGLTVTPGESRLPVLTWRELRENPEILADLLRAAGTPVELTPAILGKAEALVDASPQYLSLRMRILQSQLMGYDRTVLVWEPSVLAEDLEKRGEFSSVAVWTFPYEVAVYRAMNYHTTPEDEFRCLAPLAMPVENGFPLWRARMLHLKGVLTGQKSAAEYYQKSRLSDKEMSDFRPPTEFPDLETKKMVEERFQQLMENLRYVRLSASYQLGLISLAVKNSAAANEYFSLHVLPVPPEINPWIPSTKYALGRLYEQESRPESALETYQTADDFIPCKIRTFLLSKNLNETENPSPESGQ